MFIYDRTHTHIQSHYVSYFSESDFAVPKSSLILIFLSSSIRNSNGAMILFRLVKKTGFSICLFTTEHTLMFNRVLRRI
jgi:hypothetical protein